MYQNGVNSILNASHKQVEDYLLKQNIDPPTQRKKAFIVFLKHLGLYNSIESVNNIITRLYCNDDFKLLDSNNCKNFYGTVRWKQLRKVILKKYKYTCLKCNSKTNLVVDHIIPRSVKPELSYNKNNLQVLCNSCNLKKGKFTTDFR